MKNTNRREELEKIKNQVLANLALMPPAPSVGIHQAPPVTKVRGRRHDAGIVALLML